jgi:hypothetical protein
MSQRVYDEHGTWNDASDDTIVSTTMRDTALRYVWSGSWAHCWLEPSADTATREQAALDTYVPNREFVVVLLNQNAYGGCAGGNHQTVPRGVGWDVLAHEFGHGVGPDDLGIYRYEAQDGIAAQAASTSRGWATTPSPEGRPGRSRAETRSRRPTSTATGSTTRSC